MKHSTAANCAGSSAELLPAKTFPVLGCSRERNSAASFRPVSAWRETCLGQPLPRVTATAHIGAASLRRVRARRRVARYAVTEKITLQHVTAPSAFSTSDISTVRRLIP